MSRRVEQNLNLNSTNDSFNSISPAVLYNVIDIVVVLVVVVIVIVTIENTVATSISRIV